MAKVPAQTAPSRLSTIGSGPRLIGLGVALFVLNRIIVWLPLGWVDGPVNAILWLAIIACIALGGLLTYRKATK